jgi:hypothetical protein
MKHNAVETVPDVKETMTNPRAVDEADIRPEP